MRRSDSAVAGYQSQFLEAIFSPAARAMGRGPAAAVQCALLLTAVRPV